MDTIIHDLTGWIHFVAGCLALVSGTYVVLATKGTKLHRKMGYGYVLSMLVLIVSGFMIYRLFKGFGIFHYFNLLALLSLSVGMIPILLKKPIQTWKYLHFSFMYWSVMGLYAAFVAEMLTRIPKTPFFGMVGAATAAVMMVGGIFFGINKAKWRKAFANFK
ncbi:DUF2306 domain-containing protein [Hugenholtzia roseola]|uniref:DUF2306 domain-containing protein n=1 Tax=Hugenholtzia roseola TaxID=1002 RepID=UPI00041A2025|nr:DUF2306 domain-containing protein [Hugenholtzia roseola]